MILMKKIYKYFITIFACISSNKLHFNHILHHYVDDICQGELVTRDIAVS